MGKSTRVLAAVMSALLLVSGCSAGGKTQSEAAPKETAAATQAAKEPEAEKKEETTEAAAPAVEKLDKDVRIYVITDAGGALDVRARAIAPYLAEKLGVNVTVENIPGGGGTICATQFITQPKGKYDLLMAPATTFTSSTLFSEVSYSLEDITPVYGMDIEQFGLYVCPDKSGIHTLEELQAYGKEKEVIFGSGGSGNITHLLQAALYKSLEMQANTLPHKNAPEGITNCMGGHNMVTMAGLELARSYVEDGAIVPIMTFNREAYDGYEGVKVPSAAELGYEQYCYESLMFMSLRKDVPQEYVDFIRSAFEAAYENQECQDALYKVGVRNHPDMSSQEMTEFLQKELDGFKDMIEFIK